MALLAKLQFGDNAFRRYSHEYLVTDFKCHVTRRHNQARPDGNPKCDWLELTVVAPGRDDLILFEWFVDQSSISGRILIELSTSAQSQSPQWKEVLFENGVCYSFSEEYHIDQNRRRSLRLMIAVEEITVDAVRF